MWYSVSGLPSGANAAAFCPPPPPVVTDAADSSMGLVTRAVSMLRAVPAPPPAVVSPFAGIAGAAGAEPGFLAQMVYIGRPAAGFGELVPTRPNEMIPVPASTPNAVQQANQSLNRRPRFLGKGQIRWTRAFQRWPSVAGS